MRYTLVLASVLLTSSVVAAEYSKPVDSDYPKNVYWGDTHLHTRNSADAYSMGNMNMTPAQAYRFARGEEMVAHNGMRVQLRRPLDFLVVSDHSEYLGGFYRFNVSDPVITGTAAGKQWAEYMAAGDYVKMFSAFVDSMRDPENHPPFDKETQRYVWKDVGSVADQHNDPGQFTAFIGYEWTSMVEGNNLHRVVVYRDGAEIATQAAPFTSQESQDPRDLWKALAAYEEKTGGEVMAIAHNGNLSNGMMFPDETLDGKKINKRYAETRARWEPIYEVSQVKGDGESHPTLSPDDEFADYENWDEDNIGRTAQKEDWMLEHEYARGALKLGLQHEKNLDVNPFKFGMIASTDGHNTVSTTGEDNFFGKFPETEPRPERMTSRMALDRLWQNWRIVASGYAAIWARDNTRDALFDAMKRKEVYATTGSRISVRFFGGWSYADDVVDRPNYLDVAYSGGVPMGGDLTSAPKDTAPKFIVVAVKDPVGANLDRVQVVKGWLDRKGELHEKVYDVAWSGHRKADPETGKLPPVGNTVDADTASFTNTIGTGDLAIVWTDPDFDSKERAFYYARVIEIPRPRWTTHDSVYFDVELPEGAPVSIQDRAYTSPIWYTP